MVTTEAASRYSFCASARSGHGWAQEWRYEVGTSATWCGIDCTDGLAGVPSLGGTRNQRVTRSHGSALKDRRAAAGCKVVTGKVTGKGVCRLRAATVYNWSGVDRGRRMGSFCRSKAGDGQQVSSAYWLDRRAPFAAGVEMASRLVLALCGPHVCVCAGWSLSPPTALPPSCYLPVRWTLFPATIFTAHHGTTALPLQRAGTLCLALTRTLVPPRPSHRLRSPRARAAAREAAETLRISSSRRPLHPRFAPTPARRRRPSPHERHHEYAGRQRHGQSSQHRPASVHPALPSAAVAAEDPPRMAAVDGPRRAGPDCPAVLHPVPFAEA